MSDYTTRLELTDAEMLAIDGLVPRIQPEVEKAKARLALTQQIEGLNSEQVALLHGLIERAQTAGRLKLCYDSLKYCKACGSQAGYAKYKSGRNKGRDNHKKPLMMAGVDFSDSFIRFAGYTSLGCCTTCWNLIKPELVKRLADVKAEIPESITGTPSRFKWFKNRHCTRCDWTGSEHEMKQLPAVMGGWYPGRCPNCSAENRWLGESLIKDAKGFTLVEVAAASAGAQ